MPNFRIRWLGYDPKEVDQFFEKVAADQERLEESLAKAQDTARRDSANCWVSVQVDDSSPVERLLPERETIVPRIQRRDPIACWECQSAHDDHQ